MMMMMMMMMIIRVAILHEEVAIAKVYLLKYILWGDSYIATA